MFKPIADTRVGPSNSLRGKANASRQGKVSTSGSRNLTPSVQRRELGEVDPTPPGIILLFPLYYYYGVQRREAGEVDHTPPGTR